MKKAEIISRALRDGFAKQLAEHFAAKFDGKQIETEWNIIHTCYVSRPVYDGNGPSFRFTPEMQEFISAFEKGWMAATAVVGEWA